MSVYHLAVIKNAIRALGQGKLVIVDRWWPSEMVYGKVYRNSHEPIENLRVLHRLGLRYGAVYVLCHRETREQQLRVFEQLKKTRQEMYESDDRIGQLHDEYQKLWEAQQFTQDRRWIYYNVDRASQNDGYIGSLMHRIESDAKLYSMMREGQDERLAHSSGCISGTNVMVGEMINPEYKAMFWPWVSFQGCTRSMTRALVDLGRNENHFLWTNIMGPTGHNDQLKRYLTTLPRNRNIVAMGKHAAGICHSLGVTYKAMAHPAYITRFAGYPELVDELSRVIK